jgi:hypothetical protein
MRLYNINLYRCRFMAAYVQRWWMSDVDMHKMMRYEDDATEMKGWVMDCVQRRPVQEGEIVNCYNGLSISNGSIKSDHLSSETIDV